MVNTIAVYSGFNHIAVNRKFNLLPVKHVVQKIFDVSSNRFPPFFQDRSAVCFFHAPQIGIILRKLRQILPGNHHRFPILHHLLMQRVHRLCFSILVGVIKKTALRFGGLCRCILCFTARIGTRNQRRIKIRFCRPRFQTVFQECLSVIQPCFRRIPDAGHIQIGEKISTPHCRTENKSCACVCQRFLDVKRRIFIQHNVPEQKLQTVFIKFFQSFLCAGSDETRQLVCGKLLDVIAHLLRNLLQNGLPRGGTSGFLQKLLPPVSGNTAHLLDSIRKRTGTERISKRCIRVLSLLQSICA